MGPFKLIGVTFDAFGNVMKASEIYSESLITNAVKSAVAEITPQEMEAYLRLKQDIKKIKEAR